MAIEIEYFGLTGMVGPGSNDRLILKAAPSTGPNGAYDITVDPTDGPAQRYGIDFGVTHSNVPGTTAMLALNLANSDIKDVLNNRSHGVTGILWLRVMYNYATGMGY
jgi:hypothetical protein